MTLNRLLSIDEIRFTHAACITKPFETKRNETNRIESSRREWKVEVDRHDRYRVSMLDPPIDKKIAFERKNEEWRKEGEIKR